MFLTGDVKDTAISCRETTLQYKKIKVFESLDEEDKGPESAVEEETGENDEADWENDGSESEELLEQKQQFEKIDPKSQPVFKRSLIADMVQSESEQVNKLDMAGFGFTLNSHSSVLSPRTIRHNMRASELTTRLGKELLWERKQFRSTVNAVIKRRHKNYDMINSKEYLEKEAQTFKDNFWSDPFNQGGEYNQAGW